ncbi:MAG: DUF2500 family protein [Synechococcales cyanobacterium M58_A2018_015]|nr:DUF2500 family protein [Synechococcales cyanobacterium M58_A2018_015]
MQVSLVFRINPLTQLSLQLTIKLGDRHWSCFLCGNFEHPTSSPFCHFCLTARSLVQQQFLYKSGFRDFSAPLRANGSSTYYYATFEFSDGSREEFGVSSKIYGMVAEEDFGTLHSQETYMWEFNRRI